MPKLRPRFQAFPPYPLADVPALKRELRARGVDVIDLGVGDADLPPPPAAVARCAPPRRTRPTRATPSSSGCRSSARRSPGGWSGASA
jgi:aspartate/methionine/tyrosine aminotransferase